MNKQKVILVVISFLALVTGLFWFVFRYSSKKTNEVLTGNISSDSGLKNDLALKVENLSSELTNVQDKLQGVINNDESVTLASEIFDI